MKLLILGLASACAAFCMPLSVSYAQSNAPAPPPCESAEYRAFDFWLGQWSTAFDGKYVRRVAKQ